MKAERINQDQIRFTLSEMDLQERNLKVSELAYGSEKTQALFDDMMKTALDQFGVDFTEKPLMIEAIPIAEGKLSITVTRVSGAAELGALFGSNLPDGRRHSKEEQQRMEPVKSSEKEAKKQKEETVGLPGDGEDVIYEFNNFQELCQAAAQIPPQLPLRNMLYKDEKKGTYYLIVHYKKMDRRIRYVVAVLAQYCEAWFCGQHAEMIIKEHYKLILKARALQKLAAIEQWEDKN